VTLPVDRRTIDNVILSSRDLACDLRDQDPNSTKGSELSGRSTSGTFSSRATIKDVAALAQVSLKTVSRVMNNEPSVTEELTSRVRRAADQLRYQPNFGASALRRSDRRSSTIGVLLGDLSNPFFATIHKAVEDVAWSRSVSVLSGSLEDSAEREHELTTALTRHRVDGFIIAPASHDHQYLRQEQDAGVPFVFVDRPPVLLHADQVLSDSRGGTAQAITGLIDRGHERIGYLGRTMGVSTAEERYLGYLDALNARDIVEDESCVVRDLNSIENAELAVLRILTSSMPPTALFASQNLLTIGAVRALRELRLEHKVALVGFDDFLLADLLEPGVTVVAQDIPRMGHEAARILFDRIDGDVSPNQQLVIPTNIIERGSGEITP
jgi:LacI family transcriptional regulator